MDTVKFYEELTEFVRESRVNLGRKNTKTKEEFIDNLMTLVEKGVKGTWKPKDLRRHRNSALDSSTVICLKPTGEVKKRLHRDKGGYVTTTGDAQRADDSIGNNPMG